MIEDAERKKSARGQQPKAGIDIPLRLITMLGFIVSLLAFLAGIWALTSWLIFANTILGWTSVVLPMYFLGGIQLLSIGIIGEYLGKNYLESKHRPRFIIEKSTP